MFCASKPSTGRAAYSTSIRNNSNAPPTTNASNTESSQNLVGFIPQQSAAFNSNPMLNIPAQQFGSNRTTSDYMQLLQRAQHNPSPPVPHSLAANIIQQQTHQHLPNMNPQSHQATLNNQNQPQLNPNMSSILPILPAGSDLSLPQHQQNPMISQQQLLSQIQHENNLLLRLANLQQSYLQQSYANIMTGQANTHSIHNSGQPQSMPPHTQQSTTLEAETIKNTTNVSSNPSGTEPSNHMLPQQLNHDLHKGAQATESKGHTKGGSSVNSDSRIAHSKNNTPSAEQTLTGSASTNNVPNDNISSVSLERNVVPPISEDPEGRIGQQQEEEKNTNSIRMTNTPTGQDVSSRRDESRMNPSDSDTEQLAQRRRLN